MRHKTARRVYRTTKKKAVPFFVVILAFLEESQAAGAELKKAESGFLQFVGSAGRFVCPHTGQGTLLR